MSKSAQFLSPSEAAKKLNISTKALRLYEERGLVAPVCTEAGWRTYGPAEMARAAEIIALRALGLSLAQIARVLKGVSDDLEYILANHQSHLEHQIGTISTAIDNTRRLRERLALGSTPTVEDLAQLLLPAAGLSVAFDLPWPWGGETFELRNIAAIIYITGPLGCGKTRLARKIAETLPDTRFLEMDRNSDEALARIEADPALKTRVEKTMTRLTEDGASASPALLALLVELASDDTGPLIIDIVEHGLDHASQEALIAHLRQRGPDARPLFLLTRSNAVLDLAAVTRDETIIFCPANHNPPMEVAAFAGSPGYEALASCLASPEVRARTEGVIALRPERA